jgi:hypothetical protein
MVHESGRLCYTENGSKRSKKEKYPGCWFPQQLFLCLEESADERRSDKNP